MMNKKSFFVILVIYIFFSISCVCASELNNCSYCVDIGNESDNLDLDQLNGVSDEIIVEDWDDLQYYCSLKDKDYVLRLKENTSYYPFDSSDSAYQIEINNNVKIIGSSGAYIGDNSQSPSVIKYAAFVVPQNSKIGIILQDIKFKSIRSSYGPGDFIQIGGNANHSIINCSFEDVKVSGDHASLIYITNGDSTLDNCTFINCTTENGCVSIDDQDHANVVMSRVANCYFENNYAESHTACVKNRGATLLVFNSTFYKNRSFWWAAGIFTYNNGTTSIYDSNFTDNVAGWNGGALYTYSSLNIYNTIFVGNNCTTDNGGGAIGACVYLSVPHIYIDGCLFKNNENLCWSLNELSTAGTGRGGAISIMDEGGLEVYNSTFIRNAAAHGSAVCAYSAGSYGSPDVKIIGNRFINHTRAGDVLDIKVDESILEIRDNYYFNDSIPFSSFQLIAYEPDGGQVTFHIRSSLANPQCYESDILDKSEYDVYVDGVFVKRVAGNTFTLNMSCGADVYVISCINNLKSNVVSVGVENDYIYVSKIYGDNNNNGLTRSTPVKTIQRAINLARSCQNILIMDGSFDENGIYVSYDLTIVGESDSQFVTKNIPHFLFDASGAVLTLKNIKINGLNMADNSSRIVKQSSGLLVIDNCVVCNNSFNGLFEVDSMELINCVFENNAGYIMTNGLTMSSSIFSNNMVKSNDSLIKSSGNALSWQIRDSTFINNEVGLTALYFESSSKTLKISNTVFNGSSVLGDACSSCVYVDGSSLLNVVSCVFVNNDVGVPVIYKKSLKSNVNVKDSLFLNNSHGFVVDGDAGALTNIIIDYNWWGNSIDDLNVLPNVNSSLINNWIYLNVSVNNTLLHKNELALVVFDLNNVATSQGAVSVYDASDVAVIGFVLDVVNLTADKSIVDLADGRGSVSVMLNSSNYGILNAHYNIIGSSLVFNFTKSVPDIVVIVDNGVVNVSLPEDASGNITFHVLNTTTSIFKEIAGSDVNVALPRLTPGFYNLLVAYSGDDNYIYTEVNRQFNVSKYQSSVNVSVGEIKYGEGAVLTISVLDDATGNVSVTVNDVADSVVLIENTTFTYVVSNIKKGNNTVKVIYSGDAFYSSSFDEVAFEVSKRYSNMTVSVDNVDSRGNATVSLLFDGNASGNVTVEVDGKVIDGVVENGKCILVVSGLSAGNKKLVVNYGGDDFYASSSVVESFSIGALNTRFGNVAYNGDSLVAVIVDANGDVVSGVDIFYSVNGVESKAVSDLNGSFSINGLSDSVVVIRFDGVGVLSPCNISLSLKDVGIVKSGSVFVGDDFKQYACDYAAGERGGWYKVQLKDTNGNVLANKHVSISYNAILVNKTTDKNGFAVLQVSLKKAGTYGFVFTFLGDENFTACMAVHKVKILKKSTKLIAKAKTFKAKAKTKKYTVTLKTIKGSSANGKVYLSAGKKITLKIKGKTYTAKTNAKGKATFKLKITKKGKYTAKITFAGDSAMYKKSTAKAKITIR